MFKDLKQKGRFFTELSSRDPPSYHLKDQFFDPTSHNHRTHFPDILRAFARMPSQGCDLLFNADVREKLFLVMEERDGVLGNASLAIKVPDLAARYVRRVLALLVSVDFVEREAIGEAYKGIGPETFSPSGISTEVASTASPATTLSVATAACSRPVPGTAGRGRSLRTPGAGCAGCTRTLMMWTCSRRGWRRRQVGGKKIFPFLYNDLQQNMYTESGSILGPTFSCIMRRQFNDLMDGDAFFFTHQTNPVLGIERRWVNRCFCRSTLKDFVGGSRY